MLDPALCNRPPSHWLFLKGMLASWLITPPLVVMPLLAWSILPWMIRGVRWKRFISSLGAFFLLTYCTAFLPPAIAVANEGLIGLLPADSGETTNAIVVLGRGEELRESRVEVTAALWQADRSPLVFASGRGDAPQIVQLLRAKGIPAQALDDENCSQTTEENAQFTAAVLQPQGIHKILLVTDSPHMLRSLLTFRSLGFRVIPHAIPLPSNLAQEEKALKVVSEYMGLIKYALQGRFLPQRSSELNYPQPGALSEASNHS